MEVAVVAEQAECFARTFLCPMSCLSVVLSCVPIDSADVSSGALDGFVSCLTESGEPIDFYTVLTKNIVCLLHAAPFEDI